MTRSILEQVEVNGAVVDECIVTDRVRIQAGAEYRRAIITHGDPHPHVTPR